MITDLVGIEIRSMHPKSSAYSSWKENVHNNRKTLVAGPEKGRMARPCSRRWPPPRNGWSQRDAGL